MAEEERLTPPPYAAAAASNHPSSNDEPPTTPRQQQPVEGGNNNSNNSNNSSRAENNKNKSGSNKQGGNKPSQRRRNNNNTINQKHRGGGNVVPPADRPGAYVPVKPRPDPARRSALIQNLSTQLEYYFSPTNLLNDTYLRTLMDLNSGYAPANVVANFGNVQRIVMRWDLDGSIVAGEAAGLQTLIREAADLSVLLDVVMIDGSGNKVVASAGTGASGGADAAADSGGGPDAPAPTIANRVAIGPKGGSSMGGGVLHHQVQLQHQLQLHGTTAPQISQQQQKQAPAGPEQTTIILRDAPAATTEQDIRSVFTSAKASVSTVRSDVGNTWFVTLDGGKDGNKEKRDDVVSLLLNLRGMKLHGFPVKARLKAESVASRARGPGGGPTATGYGYAASAPQSPVAAKYGGGYRSSEQRQQGGGGGAGARKAGQRGSGTGGTLDKEGGTGSGGGRSHYGRQQSRSVPSSPAGGGAGAQYRRAGNKGGKSIVSLNAPGGKPRGGKSDDGGTSSGNKGGSEKNDNADAAFKTTAKTLSDVPPPPLEGLHFPALGGTCDKSKPVDQLQHRPKDKETTMTKGAPKEASDVKGKDAGAESTADAKSTAALSVPPSKKEASDAVFAPSDGSAKKPVGGYAAALLRSKSVAAPVAPAASSTSQTDSPSASALSSPASSPEKNQVAGAGGKELKLPPSTGGKGPSSKASLPSTAITDDSSADDKSSVSSKTESLGSNPLVAPTAPSWGGGKTFADILKKKQGAAASAGK